jgi:hypothetical protein
MGLVKVFKVVPVRLKVINNIFIAWSHRDDEFCDMFQVNPIPNQCGVYLDLELQFS